MPSTETLDALISAPTALGVVTAVALVLAWRLRKIKWGRVELSFGRDQDDDQPNQYADAPS